MSNTTPDERYFFDQDSSSHDYMTPLSRRDEWLAWRDLPEDDPLGWSEPDYAKRIDGGVWNYSFENPEPLL